MQGPHQPTPAGPERAARPDRDPSDEQALLRRLALNRAAGGVVLDEFGDEVAVLPEDAGWLGGDLGNFPLDRAEHLEVYRLERKRRAEALCLLEGAHQVVLRVHCRRSHLLATVADAHGELVYCGSLTERRSAGGRPDWSLDDYWTAGRELTYVGDRGFEVVEPLEGGYWVAVPAVCSCSRVPRMHDRAALVAAARDAARRKLVI